MTVRHSASFFVAGLISLAGVICVIITMIRYSLHPSAHHHIYIPDLVFVIIGGLSGILLASSATASKYGRKMATVAPIFLLFALFSSALGGCILYRTGVCKYQAPYACQTTYWSLLFAGPIVHFVGQIIGVLLHFHSALSHADTYQVV